MNTITLAENGEVWYNVDADIGGIQWDVVGGTILSDLAGGDAEAAGFAIRTTPTTLIGFSGAPWTLASYMIEGGTSKEFSRTRSWAYRAPEEFQVLIDCLVEATTRHLIYQGDGTP